MCCIGTGYASNKSSVKEGCHGVKRFYSYCPTDICVQSIWGNRLIKKTAVCCSNGNKAVSYLFQILIRYWPYNVLDFADCVRWLVLSIKACKNDTTESICSTNYRHSCDSFAFTWETFNEHPSIHLLPIWSLPSCLSTQMNLGFETDALPVHVRLSEPNWDASVKWEAPPRHSEACCLKAVIW